MNIDLTCKTCEGRGVHWCSWRRCPNRKKPCWKCHGPGRRLPTLSEWDALKAELHSAQQAYTTLAGEFDRYHEALYKIAKFNLDPLARKMARVTLDGDTP